ncbi:hypothetical protein BDV06DRAFT_218250 [Aspergillus oleicola]
MGVVVPSLFVSTRDWEGVRGALDVNYANQTSIPTFVVFGRLGLRTQFPKSGLPNLDWGSDTYYLLYFGDTAYIAKVWPQFTKGLERLYRALICAAEMISWLPDTTTTTNTTHNTSAEYYLTHAKTIKASILTHLWDNSTGSFKDSSLTTPSTPKTQIPSRWHKGF